MTKLEQMKELLQDSLEKWRKKRLLKLYQIDEYFQHTVNCYINAIDCFLHNLEHIKKGEYRKMNYERLC